ncbi:MAG: DUF1844 domain-containing protein [Candidatus Binataceae bacterium]
MDENQEEKGKGFKVEDRRRFSSEGELRPEFSEEPAEPSPTPPEASALHPGAPSSATTRAAAEQAVRENAAELNFATFVVGLSTEALVHLGEIPDPQSGAPMPSLPAAQQVIDIIGMLKEKTRGNLDQDEQALIDAILYDLRMKFVERARRMSR